MLDLRIETPRLLLRPLTLDDAADMFDYASDPEITRYVTWNAHRTIADSESMIRTYAFENYKNREPAPLGIILKETKKLVGTVDLMAVSPRWRVEELGYTIGRAYWNRGYMSEAAQAMIHHGFKERGLVRIQARLITFNLPSMRVLEKCGMLREGTLRKACIKNDRSYDLYMYSILRDEWLLSQRSES